MLNDFEVAVETDVLVRCFLKLLHEQELINSPTYIKAIRLLERGEEDVNQK